MSKGVDSFANTVNCIAKSNIILDIQTKFQMNFKKKTRYSVGGIHFDNNMTDYIELECDLKPKEIIDQLEQISPYGRNKNVSELFIKSLFLSLKKLVNILYVFYAPISISIMGVKSFHAKLQMQGNLKMKK